MAGKENKDDGEHTRKEKRVEHSVRQPHGPHLTVAGAVGIIHSSLNFITLKLRTLLSASAQVPDSK